jgi:hypothetical protein
LFYRTDVLIMNECSRFVKRKMDNLGPINWIGERNKMNYRIIYPTAALVLGAAGAALHRWQQGADFDELGLPVPGAATYALIGMVIAAEVLFAVLALRKTRSSRWSEALGERLMPTLWGGAALSAAAAVLLAMTLQGEGSEELAMFPLAAKGIPLLMVAGSTLAAVGQWLAASGGVRGGKNLVLPTLFGCIWTVQAYHDHGTDPAVGHFVWLLLAVIGSTLLWYELTALAMGRGHARRALFLSLSTVVLSLVALTGELTIPERLLLLSQLVGAVTSAWSFGAAE